jgi:hypothetical protein
LCGKKSSPGIASSKIEPCGPGSLVVYLTIA